MRACRADEVEEVRDGRRGLTCVHDERVLVDKPAHRDLAAVALDRFALDRAALFGDVEERLEQYAALRPAARDAAGLVGTGERVEDRLHARDALGVLGRSVDETEQP